MENKPRILVVEGDVVLAQTLASVLKTNGYDVGTARNSEEAIEYMRKRRVELVFIDSKVFVTRGAEIYERINETRPDVEVVVMMDSHLSRGRLRDIMRQGLWAPLCKPFTIDELLAVVESYTRFRAAALVIPVVHRHSQWVPDQKAA